MSTLLWNPRWKKTLETYQHGKPEKQKLLPFNRNNPNTAAVNTLQKLSTTKKTLNCMKRAAPTLTWQPEVDYTTISKPLDNDETYGQYFPHHLCTKCIGEQKKYKNMDCPVEGPHKAHNNYLNPTQLFPLFPPSSTSPWQQHKENARVR